jgi:hypothetical protein
MLTYQFVLDLAARTLSKDSAVLPGVWVHPLCCGLSTQVACELHLEGQKLTLIPTSPLRNLEQKS